MWDVRGFACVAVLVAFGCGSDGAPDESAGGLAPVDATRPTQDDRVLAATAALANAAPDLPHRTETITVSGAPLSSGGLVGGLSIDSAGNLYTANFQESVWKVSPTGVVTLLSDEFTSASGNLPLPDGDLLQAEWTDNVIYRISPTGSREVFSRSGLDGPVGIARHPDGSFIVANWRGGFLARIPANGGPAQTVVRDERMRRPNGVAVDEDGTVYISDLESGDVFTWRGDGPVEVLAELPGRGNAHAAIADGSLYVNKIWDHVIYRVDISTGDFQVVAGLGHPGYEDGPTGTATIEEPNGIAAAPDQGSVYFNTHRGIMGVPNPGRIVLRRLVLPR